MLAPGDVATTSGYVRAWDRPGAAGDAEVLETMKPGRAVLVVGIIDVGAGPEALVVGSNGAPFWVMADLVQPMVGP